jgi:hypothetical protein
VAALACERPDWQVVNTPSSGGGTIGTAGSSSSAGTIPIGGTGAVCNFDRVIGTKPILSTHAVNTVLPGRAELYLLVTDAEAEALRAGGPLVPPAEPMMPPSDVVKLLDKILPVSTALRRPVIEALRPRFTSVRRAWPNPWALRLVDHPGSQHMNIVRLVLREEAWLARITDGSIAVVGTDNTTIGPEAAAQEPERVAAIFYDVNQRNYAAVGTNACEDGRREFVIGGDAMIEEWSLGTSDISDRLESDLAQLEEFFKVARSCSNTALPNGSFRSSTVCTTWASPYSVHSEYTAYVWSLSTPSELYKPTSQNLAGLIEALQGDRFELGDEYIVNPQPPAVGGAGNEGGAGGSGGDAAPGSGGAN